MAGKEDYGQLASNAGVFIYLVSSLLFFVLHTQCPRISRLSRESALNKAFNDSFFLLFMCFSDTMLSFHVYAQAKRNRVFLLFYSKARCCIHTQTSLLLLSSIVISVDIERDLFTKDVIRVIDTHVATYILLRKLTRVLVSTATNSFYRGVTPSACLSDGHTAT